VLFRSHIFHTPNKELADLWEKEFKGLFVKKKFWCKNVTGKNFEHYWDYPISIEGLKNYPLHLKKKIYEELKNLNSNKKLVSRTYFDYVKNEVGPTLSRMFFSKYPEKIWGISTRKLTAEWAPKRIELRKKITPFYHEQWNAVAKFGTGSIYENLKRKIIKLGGKFHFNCNLEGISFEDSTITYLNFKKKRIKINSQDTVVSSLPINLTARFFKIDTKLKFRGIRSVYLAFKQKKVLPKDIHWLYFGDKKILFNRLTEPKKMSKYVSTDKLTYLTAEITYSKNDRIDLLSERRIISLVLKDILKTGLVEKKNFLCGSSNKEPFVYPLMFNDYQLELSKVKSSLLKYQQLYSVGTGGDFNYADSQILFHKAFDLAEVISNKDLKSINIKRDKSTFSFNQNIEFKNIKIGTKFKTFVIAEAGINHNGSVEIAKKLIDQAKLSGCSAIKFQSFQKNTRISAKVKSSNYAEQVNHEQENLFQLFKRLSLSFSDQEKIFDYARYKNVEIFSTPFDKESVDFLESQKVKIYKIASMDLVNLPLIEYVAKKNKPIILSTGMSSLAQIDDAVNLVREVGNKNLSLLHCNSTYPSTEDSMNLNVINSLKLSFGLPAGISDHTLGILIPLLSVLLKANIVEKHFTLNKSFDGPDHILSADLEDMKQICNFADKFKYSKKNESVFDNIKKYNIEKIIKKKISRNYINLILGDGVKRILASEYETINLQRKSLYAKNNIREGQIIKENDLVIKGPGGGLLPKYLDIVVGKKANQSIKADYPITWEIF
jgi:N,N'-diacetyllegionaminate synthase